jgi:hypothetical protein
MIPIVEDQIIEAYNMLVVNHIIFFVPSICMFLVVDAERACIDADVHFN